MYAGCLKNWFLKMKQYIYLLIATILLFILALAQGCNKDKPIPGKERHLKIKVIAKNLEIPWGMAYLPNGDFIFCERNGRINLLKKDASDHDLIMKRSVDVSEGGLLGLALDPDFSSTGYVFIYETTLDTFNQVARLRLQNDVISEDKIILKGIPKSFNHDGGGLAFGPDGYLYVGTGDALQKYHAQDKNSLAGKILRIDKEGSPAPGNPFGNAVWTYGHRNVQGFAWNEQGRMIATEHGPSGAPIEFGWCCHDEINLIEPGKNYGWPYAIGGAETDSLTPAIYNSGNDTWAPSGGTFIKGKEWGAWENNFVLAGLRGERLIRFVLNADASQVIAKYDTLNGEFLRLRNIIQAPDGSLVFSSSNTDRINPQPLPGDDKIYKMYFE